MRHLANKPLFALFGVLLIKSILQLVLYQQGFISVTADEFARGLINAQWALHPKVDLAADVQALWFPFEKYLNGVSLLLWPDVIWAPRLTVFLFSCLLLVALYRLAARVFESQAVAGLTSLLLIFQPWHAWLGGSPMLDSYYLACFVMGLSFWVDWLKNKQPQAWVWAGVWFLLATGFHLQSWTYINFVHLLSLPYLYQQLRAKQWDEIRRLLGVYLLSNAFVILYTLTEFLVTGRIFNFLSIHTTYSKWFYGGYEVPVLEKLWYYPQLILDNSSLVLWLVLAGSLVLFWRPIQFWKLLLLAFGLIVLGFNSIVNVFSVPPTAAPERYTLLYVLIALPYVAYSCYRLYQSRFFERFILGRPIARGLALGILAYLMLWGGVRLSQYPKGEWLPAIEIGRKINSQLKQMPTDNAGTYMTELRYWDFLGVQLTAGHYEAVVYDRAYEIQNRTTPSIFLQSPNAIYAQLDAAHVNLVALRDPELKANAILLDFLHPIDQAGEWTLYTVTYHP